MLKALAQSQVHQRVVRVQLHVELQVMDDRLRAISGHTAHLQVVAALDASKPFHDSRLVGEQGGAACGAAQGVAH